jgi:hypothetical protein
MRETKAAAPAVRRAPAGGGDPNLKASGPRRWPEAVQVLNEPLAPEPLARRCNKR